MFPLRPLSSPDFVRRFLPRRACFVKTAIPLKGPGCLFFILAQAIVTLKSPTIDGARFTTLRATLASRDRLRFAQNASQMPGQHCIGACDDYTRIAATLSDRRHCVVATSNLPLSKLFCWHKVERASKAVCMHIQEAPYFHVSGLSTLDTVVLEWLFEKEKKYLFSIW